MITIICPCCNRHISQNTSDDLFWSYVDKHGPIPPSEKKCTGNCWNWYGTINRYGYGVFKGKTKRTTAHRYSYKLSTQQEITKTQYVCHRCDNPRCVNPAHLFLGSAKDNYDDMFIKGRSRLRPGIANVGENHPQSKLKNDDILKILRLRKEGNTFRSIASNFGVATTTIENILCGRIWTHITGISEMGGGPKIGNDHPAATLTEKIVKQIRNDSSDGMTYQELADKYNSKVSTMRDVVKLYTWKHVKD